MAFVFWFIPILCFGWRLANVAFKSASGVVSTPAETLERIMLTSTMVIFAYFTEGFYYFV